jgi:hypothetical protein
MSPTSGPTLRSRQAIIFRLAALLLVKMIAAAARIFYVDRRDRGNFNEATNHGYRGKGMLCLQWHRLSTHKAAGAAGSQDLSGALREMQRQGKANESR